MNDVLQPALQRAQARQLPVMELLSIAGRLSGEGNIAGAIELYRTWLAHNAANPLAYAMHFNFAVMLSNAGDSDGARAALGEAIRINPEFMPPYINLGQLLERKGAGAEGVQLWYQVVNKLHMVTGENINLRTAALKQIGRVLEQVFIDEKAEEALRFGLDIKPDQLDVIQHWISLRQRQCKWPAIAPWPGLSKEQLLRGISALSLAAHTDDPLLQLANAHHYNVNAVGRPSRSFADMHARRRLTLSKSRGARLKIGYLSSDLREHAVGFLTPQVYELHDRAKVEVFLYYCNTLPEDAMQRRIRAAGDHWCDIAGMTDEQAAERIVADGIDILVDLNGYTNGARTKMLSMRPAPVIVNWLGYPGTMASPYHDYLVADGFIIPESHEIYYSEKVLRLPCYQPNDRQRVIADSRPTRPDAKLPEDAVVFCCFNGVHKITPFTWRRWMSILRQVPKGVLWLLEGVETTNARLKQLMADHGIAPERLVFAPKMTNANHLARYPLADLFLDTSPYGAHTTSSDALWLGVPVLTLVGRSFASRVCGSLVTAAGLPELVVRDPGAYVAMAVDLGNHPDKLKALRVKLAAQRDTCVLFDMKLLVARLEDLYAQMWSDFEAGTIPRPNLANLDIYNEIGIALDDPNIELLAVGDYQDRYRQKLIEFDNFSPLPPDARLWPPSQVRKYR